jgi:3'(2'), 5'-bisphosphate nucleotidase
MLPEPELLDRLVPIARAAAAAIMEVYATDFVVANKGDASPVTEADRRAEALILPELASLAPGVPIVSEESWSGNGVPEAKDRYWLVDPLDGTREFVARKGEFTVNIALVERGAPLLGVVLAPATGRAFAGIAHVGAFLEDAVGQRRTIACRTPPRAGLTVVSSRSHGDRDALETFLAGRTVAARLSLGSSLKFCLVASGEADLYPRFGRTMEWDTAAGHAVLRAAGGRVTDLNGVELRYGKPGYANPPFVATGLAAQGPGAAIS